MVGQGQPIRPHIRLTGQEAGILILSRTILDLFLPPAGPLIIISLGAAILRWHRKFGRTLIISGFLSIYLLSTGLAKNLLMRPLENDFPPLRERVATDAIVILTNGIKDLSHLQLEPRPDSHSLERVFQGYAVYSRSKNTPVIVSGGKADPSRPGLSIGESLRKALIELGIPEEDLLVEDDSLNTCQGAIKVAEMLKGTRKRVVLVTSGYHMARSVRLYTKAGFTVFPAPTNFLGEQVTLDLHAFIPKAHNLEISSIAIYEYLCTLWYVVPSYTQRA